MDTSPTRNRRAWLLLPVVIAVALPLWQTQLRDGWLEMAVGSLAWLFWIAVVVWAVLTFVAIRWHRAWWLLLTAPVVLYPVVITLFVVAACATGDCF